MRLLYTFGIRLYVLFIHLASLFNEKAKLWVKGRVGLFQKLEKQFKENNRAVYWFHAASLGEFEQGRPVMEAIKTKQPEVFILLTFSSPSGYEIRKNYAGADAIYYLPADTKSNAKRFIELVKPSKVIFIKYEFWMNFIIELQKTNIELYLISGLFRPSHYFFKPYGKWFLNKLRSYRCMYLQNQTSYDLLVKHDFKNIALSNDTRFDRVVEIAKNKKDLPLVSGFCKDSFVLVAGSTWLPDEQYLTTIWMDILKVKPNAKLIIAPHEIDATHLQSIEKLITQQQLSYVKYSELKLNSSAQILLIDNIGLLSSLYAFAHIAYIGGAFGKAVHNTLEAAVYGIPLIHGPNYLKFAEAISLVELGASTVVQDQVEIRKTIEIYATKESLRIEKGNMAKQFVLNNLGATLQIVNGLCGEQNNHDYFMQLALDEAYKGIGNVAPNPLVGAVLVHNNQVIAKGHHEKYGQAHAEVNCLRDISDTKLLVESILYVTLEPCSHHGKTPPCADLILTKGIKQVVICNVDTNPMVGGKGIKKLMDAGVTVITGVLEAKGRELNKRFFCFHEQKKPYIILKWAQTEDGFISKLPIPINPNDNWITCPESKKLVHEWRAQEQGILTGTNTVLADDPQLNTRLVQGNNPVRIILDKDLRIPQSAKVYNQESHTYIINQVKEESIGQTHYKKVDFDPRIVELLLSLLYTFNIQSIIVEGGAETLNSFISQGLWNEARVFYSSKVFGNGIKAPDFKAQESETKIIQTDTLKIYYHDLHRS